MKHKHLRFSKSIAFKWIISYSVIMLIPLIVSAIIYLQTKQIVEYEIERAGNAMLKQMQNTVDSEINQAEKLAMQLSIHNDVNKYLTLTPAAEGAESFQIYQTRQELSKYKSANDFIEGIYLYSGSLDRVLTDETYTDSVTFYEMNQTTIGLTYEDWLAQLNGGAADGGTPMPYIEFRRWADKVVMMKPFASTVAGNAAKGMLVLPLNGSKIQSMLENVDWVNMGDVYITDDQQQILFQNNDSDTLLAVQSAQSAQRRERDGRHFISRHRRYREYGLLH